MKSLLFRLFLVLGMCVSAALARDEKNASSSVAAASSQSHANVEAEIATIDDERRNAYLQNDAATLDRILADDVSAISGIGSEDGKAAILSDVKSYDLTYKKLTYDHRKIRIYGDTAVVTSHAEVVANYKEKDLTGKLLVTRVYAKQQGNWKLVAIQSTRIPEQVSTAGQDATYQATAEDTSKVLFVPAKQLDSEIHKAPESGPGVSFIDLIEYTSKGAASVTRRTRPGRADVHKRLTDMWYVIEGGGTLVTGGSLLEPTQTEADELRGQGITGGEERQIGKDDFVRIPAGVPHWVRKIDGKELVYLVVKVASPGSMKPEEASSVEAELRAAMDERRKASLEGDTEQIASSLADEYLQTDISGYVQDKTAWLNEYFKPLAELIKAGKFRWEVYERKDVQIRMYGDCAVVMGTLEAKGSGARYVPAQHTWVADPNATFSGTLHFTHLNIRRNGKWLLVALQNAIAMPPPSANK
jgi:mannose-6-phosphate isomerase-like protein (cupin superfamily)